MQYFVALALVFFVGCGGSTPGGPGPGPGPTGTEFFPLAVGASWTFNISSMGVALGEKTQTVMEETTLPGVTGAVFRLESLKPSGNTTVSWQQVRGNDVVRYEELILRVGLPSEREIYVPYKLRVSNAMTAPGDARTESYTEESYDENGTLTNTFAKVEDWRIEAIESVTVPAGTFEQAVRVRRTSQTTGSDKTYWFVDGVGKIREEAANQTEELQSYTLP
jgi:hypothetical protein